MGRSSRLKIFYELDVLENFAKFTGKYLRQSHFFHKVKDFHLQLCEKCDSDTGVLLRN